MSDNAILHYGIVKVRVVGSGNLDLELRGYDNILTKTIAPIAMSSTIKKMENRLTNFSSQQAMVYGSTDAIDEVFNINSITVFVKRLYSEYAQ